MTQNANRRNGRGASTLEKWRHTSIALLLQRGAGKFNQLECWVERAYSFHLMLLLWVKIHLLLTVWNVFALEGFPRGENDPVC